MRPSTHTQNTAFSTAQNSPSNGSFEVVNSITRDSPHASVTFGFRSTIYMETLSEGTKALVKRVLFG